MRAFENNVASIKNSVDMHACVHILLWSSQNFFLNNGIGVIFLSFLWFSVIFKHKILRITITHL